jgi:PhnB protein
MTIQDVFWGDRSGEVRDPYGHVWDIATNKRILSREEMKTAEEKWLIQQHSPIV